MTKKLVIISLFFVGLFLAQVPAQAQDPLPKLPRAGLTPESRFYFLDQWGEGIQMFFTFSGQGKARIHVSLVGERVSEIKIMLGRETLNLGAIEEAFAGINAHTNGASIILNELKARADTAPLAAILANNMTAWEGFLDEAIRNSEDKLKTLAEAEREALLQRMDDLTFVQAMENALTRIADEIDAELGRPLEGLNIISSDVDVDDDSYSSTHEAESDTVVDLTALNRRVLAGTGNWESGDVVFDDDSLDITFEKEYAPVIIDGIELTPQASVTISVTINSPRQGMTSMHYDIDITLETESEELIDFLEDKQDEAKENIDGFSDQLENQMEASLAAREAIKEAEEAKQELIYESAEEGITIPAGTFDDFDTLLAQAESALAARNYQEARQLAKRAEGALEMVEKIIGELRKLKKEAEKRLERERELQEEERDLAPKPPRVPREEEPDQTQEPRQQRPIRPEDPRRGPVKPQPEPPSPPEGEEERPGVGDNDRRTGIPCRADRDCVAAEMICPMVIGSDTPQCGPGGVCICGPGRDIM